MAISRNSMQSNPCGWEEELKMIGQEMGVTWDTHYPVLYYEKRRMSVVQRS